MKKYTLLLEEEHHRYLKKLAAELGLSIKSTLLKGADILANKHNLNLHSSANEEEMNEKRSEEKRPR